MSKHEGAFVEGLRHVIDEDFKAKAAAIKEVMDNPGKYPEQEAWTGQQWAEFIFGDIQNFADKMRNLK